MTRQKTHYKSLYEYSIKSSMQITSYLGLILALAFVWYGVKIDSGLMYAGILFGAIAIELRALSVRWEVT